MKLHNSGLCDYCLPTVNIIPPYIQNFGSCGTKSSAIGSNVALPGCHSNQQTAEQFASQFKAVYYPSVDDSAAVDEFLYEHENYVASNGKTADADKLCTEISIELKMWESF